jgi:hypothetical protein
MQQGGENTQLINPRNECEDQSYIEITPEMIESGVAELRERLFGEPLDQIVIDVFIAILAAKRAEP